MYLALFMAVARRVAISSGEAHEEDYEGHTKNIANLHSILRDEKWTHFSMSQQEEILIAQQSNYIYFKKRDEVDWAADNMYLVREELKGVGSLISQPVKFKTNLLEGYHRLLSFDND